MVKRSEPEPGNPDQQRPASRWQLDPRWAALALLVILWLDVWAWFSTDPDYYLPDLFRPLAVFVVLVFLGTGFIRKPKLRAWLRGGVLFVVTSALLLELFIAVKPPRETDRIVLTDDPLLRYHYTPNLTIGAGGSDSVVNQFGLWDQEYEIPKPDDVYRVIVIGGSMGNDGATRFEDRYHAQLEVALAGAHPQGKRIEVINVSCEGYNTLQQVRLLEQKGIQYDPDLVIVSYQLSDPFLQHGGGRQVGNSRFLFRFLLPINAIAQGSKCGAFSPFYGNYGYYVMVQNPLEHLRLLGEHHGFESMVAVMPVVEEFDDAACVELYDQVMTTAETVGLPGIRVPDAFVGMPAKDFMKPDAPGDVAHPNVAGHTLIAKVLEQRIREHLGGRDR